MAKKEDLLKEAKALKLKLTPKNTIAEITEALKQANSVKKIAKTKPEQIEKKSTASENIDSIKTKAGKRSKKGIEEAQIKAKKEARKLGEKKPDKQLESIPQKLTQKPTRPKIERRGRKYQENYKKIDSSKLYSLQDAIKLAVDTSITKFDSTVEMHIRLNVDPKLADQNIRETVVLPAGTGKSLKVAVFAPSEEHDKALKAGADIVGEKDILDKLAKEEIDFDVLIATPQVMSQLGRFAKLLGPRGLMPNPKSGTVTTNVPEAVKQVKAGKIELRIDKQGIVHCGIGKVSFDADKLYLNARAVIDAIKSAKPASVKGVFIISTFLSTTMGPSIRVDYTNI